MSKRNKVISGIYTKSDLRFIHLLAKRGLNFDDSHGLLMKERDLKHSNNSLVAILGTFSKVAKIDRESIRTSKDRQILWVRQMFCHYARKHTSLSNNAIGNFMKINHSTVTHSNKKIQNDVDTCYPPTMEFLDKINQELTK